MYGAGSAGGGRDVSGPNRLKRHSARYALGAREKFFGFGRRNASVIALDRERLRARTTAEERQTWFDEEGTCGVELGSEVIRGAR